MQEHGLLLCFSRNSKSIRILLKCVSLGLLPVHGKLSSVATTYPLSGPTLVVFMQFASQVVWNKLLKVVVQLIFCKIEIKVLPTSQCH
jgi:hypothetical protein